MSKQLILQLKYLPTWVYASIINLDDREEKLLFIDFIEEYSGKEYEIELTKDDEDDIFNLYVDDVKLLKLFEFTLTGMFNPRTGEKDRHGIIGGNSMFRPEYNSVFLFTDNDGAEYYLSLYAFSNTSDDKNVLSFKRFQPN